MRFYERTLNRADVEAAMHRYVAREAASGFGICVVERVSDGAFLGQAGLQWVPYEAPFTPAVEVGWRLARAHWGQGYATEAARLSLAYGFGSCGLQEIVAAAVPGNLRSLKVMERAGMRRDLDGDFEHPALPSGHPLRPHALYRARAAGLDVPGGLRPGEMKANG